ncbi:hypothetical protein HY468_04770 [Candidatus Roizmanbacteria bacterium]|nr:hypothetical protein [Candidatus Roizmanbacteria bacterium]
MNLIKKNYQRFFSGFTLVELVISTAILMSVAGFGSASYLNFNEKQVLEQTGKRLVADLRLAQQRALAGEKDKWGCTVAGVEQPLAGWCVSPGSTGDAYTLYGSCGPVGEFSTDPGNTEPIPTPVGGAKTFDPTTRTLPQGVVFRKTAAIDAQAKKNVMGISTWVETGKKILFLPLGEGVLLYATDPGTGQVFDSQTNGSGTIDEVAYCLYGTLPALGTNRRYVVRVTGIGGIVDEGFHELCPWDAGYL